MFEPASKVLHRGGQTYGRPSARLVEQQSCNEERVFWRNLPADLLCRSLPRHAAVLAANGHADDAAAEVRDLDPKRLLPEEAGLIEAISGK